MKTCDGCFKYGKWMRHGKYKAVSIASPYGKGDWQLYNVIDDPGEIQDLAKAQNRQF